MFEDRENVEMPYPPRHLHFILFELLKNAAVATIKHCEERGVDTSKRPIEVAVTGAVTAANGVVSSSPQKPPATPVGRTPRPPGAVAAAREDNSSARPEEKTATIRIRDQGGGIPRVTQEAMWTYLFSDTSKDTRTTSQASAAKTDPDMIQSVDLASDNIASESVRESRVGSLHGGGCGMPLAALYARYLGGQLTVNSIPRHGTDAVLHICVPGDPGGDGKEHRRLGAGRGGKEHLPKSREMHSIGESEWGA